MNDSKTEKRLRFAYDKGVRAAKLGEKRTCTFSGEMRTFWLAGYDDVKKPTQKRQGQDDNTVRRI